MKRKKHFMLWASASLLCMAAIFMFSSSDSEQSGKTSGFFVDTLLSVLKSVFNMPKTAELAETLSFLVRKAAHLFIFFVLGICTANTVKHVTKSKKIIFGISLGWSSFYAATDELHQYFVPGRHCMWQDWLIDTAGALAGVSAVLIFIRRQRKGLREAV